MYECLNLVDGYNMISSLKKIQLTLPKSFEEFSNTRIILDCTEVSLSLLIFQLMELLLVPWPQHHILQYALNT